MVRQIGDANDMKDKQRTFHVNMLKRWYEAKNCLQDQIPLWNGTRDGDPGVGTDLSVGEEH